MTTSEDVSLRMQMDAIRLSQQNQRLRKYAAWCEAMLRDRGDFDPAEERAMFLVTEDDLGPVPERGASHDLWEAWKREAEAHRDALARMGFRPQSEQSDART